MRLRRYVAAPSDKTPNHPFYTDTAPESGAAPVAGTLGFTMTEPTVTDREPPTLARLNALLAAGYRIDNATSQKVGDAVWLDHPAESRAQEPTLILYPNGLVVSDCAKDPTKKQLRFDPNQELEFGRFVKAVPVASLWERSADFRTNAIVLAAFLIIIAVIWAVVGSCSQWLTSSETQHGGVAGRAVGHIAS